MKLEPTGERVIEEHYRSSEQAYLIYLFHLATYRYAKPHVLGKRVLDYGCGSGYGTSLISNACSSIIGCDIASDAIAYAQSHYHAPNLSYQVVSPASDDPLPFADASFDVVLSFQVIEHIRDVNSYLLEIKRVLTPDGLVIIATPDRRDRLLRFQKPWNIWHVREYSSTQLHNTLAAHFSTVTIQEMGGQDDVLRIELSRTRRLRWITLPFTLLFVPEFVRAGCLGLLKSLVKRRTQRSRLSYAPAFDESALSISPHEKNSVNLIATARNA